MRVVLQRVSEARVKIDGDGVGEIERGHVLLVGFRPTDTEDEPSGVAAKVLGLRVFADSAGKMNLDLFDVGGDLLVVSQFTLYGDTRKGRRPSFVGAAPPDVALPLYDRFLAILDERAPGKVESGHFEI